jgi:hypothetical protein
VLAFGVGKDRKVLMNPAIMSLPHIVNRRLRPISLFFKLFKSIYKCCLLQSFQTCLVIRDNFAHCRSVKSPVYVFLFKLLGILADIIELKAVVLGHFVNSLFVVRRGILAKIPFHDTGLLTAEPIVLLSYTLWNHEFLTRFIISQFLHLPNIQGI